MKYLLIEDDQNKSREIFEYIESIDAAALVDGVDNLSDARHKILTKSYDLIVFDIYLPLISGQTDEQDVSADIVAEFAKSKNYYSEAIAITKYEDDALVKSPLFNDNGITVVAFGTEDSRWKQSLLQKFEKIKNKRRLDFIVFCALAKERNGYRSTSAVLGEFKQIGGLNCQEMAIGNYRGMCITPSGMGLVNMAITCAKAIELFAPRIISMSGICAGVEGESNLLDIVIGRICWEYQTGKYKDGKFCQEPYQVPMSPVFRTDLEQLIEQPLLLKRLKEDLFDTELKESIVRIAPISSGSVVIADAARMAQIGEQHRKWGALEMEMYAMYEAANQSVFAPLFFGAKAVVDMGDSAKGDALHASACVISARFIVEVMNNQLPKLIDK